MQATFEEGHITRDLTGWQSSPKQGGKDMGNDDTKNENAPSQSELKDLLFTLLGEMESQSEGIMEIARDKIIDDEDGSRNLMVIGGVVGMLAECLKVALEKSK
ncbi:MAG: hypothetical protein V3U75_01490 [Methylococcaceae bacterium]